MTRVRSREGRAGGWGGVTASTVLLVAISDSSPLERVQSCWGASTPDHSVKSRREESSAGSRVHMNRTTSSSYVNFGFELKEIWVRR